MHVVGWTLRTTYSCAYNYKILLHQIFKKIIYTDKPSMDYCKYWPILLLLTILVIAALGIYNYREILHSVRLTTSRSRSLPHPIPNFVGREEEVGKLLKAMQYESDSPRIVSITGSPGFGKSTLAIHVGHKLIDKGVAVSYVDMNEVPSMHVLAEKVFDSDDDFVVVKEITMDRLYRWAKELSKQVLLILDNCDERLETNKDEFQTVIAKLASSLNLKVLTTSRRKVIYTVKHESLDIPELSTTQACALLQDVTSSIDDSHCEQITSLTGSVPLALHVVGAI